MRVIQLAAKNFKRLVAVDLRIDTEGGGLVVISGRNGAGKSSVLDAMWAALGGGTAVPGKPIREGEVRAQVEVTLAGDELEHGPYVVTRSFTHSNRTGTLTVRAAGGKAFSSPQKLLDSFLGDLTFDPLAFARMRPQDQTDTLLSVVDVGIDLAENARAYEAEYAARRDANRELKRMQTIVAEIPPVPPGEAYDIWGDVPDEEAAHTFVLGKLDAARVIQEERDDADSAVAEAAYVYNSTKNRLKELRAEVCVLKRQVDEDADALTKAQDAVEEMVEVPDIEALRAELGEVDAVNTMVRLKRDRKVRAAGLAAAEDEVEQHDRALTEIEDAKRQALAGASMLVDNLSLGGEGILYGEVPFAQASDSEKLRVSTAIGMGLNPQLKVMRITDGSLLDDDSMAELSEMARERGYDIWCERVGDEEVGFVIEEGMVASRPGS